MVDLYPSDSNQPHPLNPPLPDFIGERGKERWRGSFAPSLIYTPPSLYKIKNTKWELKRGRAPLH